MVAAEPPSFLWNLLLINKLIVKLPQRILNVLKFQLCMIIQDEILITRPHCAVQVLNIRMQKTFGMDKCPQLILLVCNLKEPQFLRVNPKTNTRAFCRKRISKQHMQLQKITSIFWISLWSLGGKGEIAVMSPLFRLQYDYGITHLLMEITNEFTLQ